MCAGQHNVAGIEKCPTVVVQVFVRDDVEVDTLLMQPVHDVQVGVQIMGRTLAVVEPGHDTLRSHIYDRAEPRTVADPRSVTMPVVEAEQPVVDDVLVLLLDGVSTWAMASL